LTIICYPFWTETNEDGRPWAQAAIEIIPSILGFSLGGMAILLAFSNEKFLEAIRQGGKVNSAFMSAVVAFFHFILFQTGALSMAFVSKAWPWWGISLVGFFLLAYGMLVSVAVAGRLLQLSRVFNATGFIGKGSDDNASGGPKGQA
jgi:hypothetical protein